MDSFEKIEDLVDLNHRALKSYFRATMPLRFALKDGQLNNLSDLHSTQSKKAVYVHIPFCESLCSFCELNIAVSNNQNLHSEYLIALKNELELKVKKGTQIDYLYIGGGSPSSLSLFHLETLINMIGDHFYLSKDCEISIEYHPRHLSLEKLKLLKKNNFTNLILGIQDFNQVINNSVNRPNSLNHLNNIFEFSFKYTAEFILGLPMQNEENLEQLIQTSLNYPFEELQFYPLKLTQFNKDNSLLLGNSLVSVNQRSLDNHVENINNLSYFTHSKMTQHFQSNGFGHYSKKTLRKSKRRLMGNIPFDIDQIIGFGVSAISFYENYAIEKNSNYINTYLKNNFTKNKTADNHHYYLNEIDRNKIDHFDSFMSSNLLPSDLHISQQLLNELTLEGELNQSGMYFKDGLSYYLLNKN